MHITTRLYRCGVIMVLFAQALMLGNLKAQTTLVTQGFNSSTAPSGWSTIVVADPGTNPSLTFVTSGTYPTCSPNESTRMVEFNSYYSTAGAEMRLYQTTSFSTASYSNITVNFNWYEVNELSSYNDYVKVQWSTNGSSWTDATTYNRYNSTTGWKNKSCTLPSGASGQSNLYVAFLFHSGYGDNCHLDNMTATGAISGPNAPVFSNTGSSSQICFNNAYINDNTPLFRASASGTSTITKYSFEINTAADYSGTAYSQTFTGSYTAGTSYDFDCSSLSPALPTTADATYYVRVKASYDGTVFGNWSSETYSFTYKSSGDLGWYEKTNTQLATNTQTTDVVTNIPLNRSFETGTLDNWTQTATVPSGEYGSSRVVSGSGNPTTTDGSYQMFEQIGDGTNSASWIQGQYIHHTQSVSFNNITQLKIDNTTAAEATSTGAAKSYIKIGNDKTYIDSDISGTSNDAYTNFTLSPSYTGDQTIALGIEYTHADASGNLYYRHAWFDNLRLYGLTSEVSSSIDMASVPGGTDWDQLSWTTSGANGSATVQVEYYNGSSWAIIPNSALSNNSSGFSSSPVDLKSIDVTTYSKIRLKINYSYSSGRPNLSQWKVQILKGCTKPAASAGSNKLTCSGQGVAIGGSPTGSGGSGSGYTYNWSPSTGLSSTTVANPTASPTVATTYSVTVTDGGSCVSLPATIIVTVPTTSSQYLANSNVTQNVVGGYFYDSGGSSSSYSYNENYTITFYPCNANDKLRFAFSSFDMEYASSCNYDNLKIYNGPNTSSALIGTYCGTSGPGTITSSHASGAITFVVTSDGSVTGAGWAAAITSLCNQPTAEAGTDKSYCSSAVTLGGSPAASGGSGSGYTYNWSPSSGLSSTTVANPTASPTATTTYSVSVTDGNGCLSQSDAAVAYVSGANAEFRIRNFTYTVSNGKFYDSGGSGASYAYNEDYTVTFYPCDVNKKLRFEFTSFDLESQATCNYDWLQIYNGPSTSSSQIGGKYCGTTSPGTITSTDTSGALTFVFHSDGSVTAAGWAANISSYCIKPTADAGDPKAFCTGGSASVGGSPAASGGSGTYTYAWTPSTGLSSTSIANPTASPTATTTYTLQVNDNIGCAADAKTVRVSISGSNEQYYGNRNQTYTIGAGKIYDSGGPSLGYTTNEDYIITVYPCEASKRVSLNFTSFDLETDATCSYDWLKIYNGSSISSTLIGTYCGTNSPGVVSSTDYSGALTLRFRSDGSVTANGFEAIVSLVKNCTSIAGNISISSAGDGCASGTAQLSLSGNIGQIVGWQRSFNNVDYSAITNSANSTYSEFDNTKTWYRIEATMDNETCFSNVVSYNTSRNFYVNDNSTQNDIYCTAIGASGNNGLIAVSPMTSINSLLSAYDITGCDTIFVDAGAYSEGVEVTATDYGDSLKPVIIIGADTTHTVFTAPSGKDNFKLYRTQYLVLKNIAMTADIGALFNVRILEASRNTVEGCKMNNSAGMNVYAYGYKTTEGKDASKTQVFNNHIVNTSSNGQGVYIIGDADFVEIKGNYIRTMGTNNADGIFITSYYISGNPSVDIWPTRVNIHNNTVIADDYGISLYGGIDHAVDLCSVHDNNIFIQSNDIADGAGIWLYNIGSENTKTTTVYNNKVVGGKSNIYFGNHTRYATVYNNFFSGSETGMNAAYTLANYNNLYFNSFYNTNENLHFYDLAYSFWNVKNNIFYTTANNAYSNLFLGSSNVNFASCDYNIFFAPNGAKAAVDGLYSYTFNEWKNHDHDDLGTNGDEHSLSGDPEYLFPQNNNLLTHNGSLGFHAGVFIESIILDILGHSRNNPPSIGGGDGVLSASDLPYAGLVKKLDGGYYEITNGYLKFVYTEEYSPATNAKLNYKIYDNMHSVITTTTELPLKMGENWCTLNVVDCDMNLPNGFYLLEVANEKNEKWFMKFNNSTPSSLYCNQ